MHENAYTYLHVTFCNIKRCDTGMGNATCKDTSKHTFGVVRGIVDHRPEISG